MINDGIMKETYKKYSIILILLVCTISIINYLTHVFPFVKMLHWKNYIMPFLWCCVIGWIAFLPKIHPRIKVSKKDYIYFDAIKYAIVFLGIRYLAGFFIYEIGKTPYDISLKGIWLNFISVILPFIAIELVRGYILGAYCKKKNIAFFIAVIVITTFFGVNISNIIGLNSIKSTTIYIAQDLGPLLCKNILLTYFALYGGATAAIFYGGLLLIFHWFFPVLPELNWLGDGSVGILIPLIQLMFLISKYENVNISKRREKVNVREGSSWLGVLVFSVTLIWFVVGVFPIYPFVIVTGSMKPLISPGDVALVKQFYHEKEIYELSIGDILVFRRDDIVITHRIIDMIYDEEGYVSFRTKGDNNSAEDVRLVLPEEVIGRYVAVVPKIGYPTLWLKSDYLEQREDVEY